MEVMWRLLLLVPSVLTCFCPPLFAPSCGCSGGGAPSGGSYAPQTIFYSQAVPLNDRIGYQAGPGYAQQPYQGPVIVESTYVPVGGGGYGGPAAPQYYPQPQYQQPQPQYQPQQPQYPPPSSYVEPQQYQPQQVVPQVTQDRPQVTSHFETQTFDVPQPQPVAIANPGSSSVIINTPPASVDTTFIQTAPLPVPQVPQTQVVATHVAEEVTTHRTIVEVTTVSPTVRTTTRIVPIPRKKGDGKKDDYEYFYVYYDDDGKNTTKPATGPKKNTVVETEEDFPDGSTDQAKETSIDDDRNPEAETAGNDYNFDDGVDNPQPVKIEDPKEPAPTPKPEIASYNNVATQKPVVAAPARTEQEFEYFDEGQNSVTDVKTTTLDPDLYEEYEVEEFVPINPDGTEGKPQVVNIITTTESNDIDKLPYKRDDTRLTHRNLHDSDGTDKSVPLRGLKVLKKRRRKMVDGSIVRRRNKTVRKSLKH